MINMKKKKKKENSKLQNDLYHMIFMNIKKPQKNAKWCL